MQTRNLQRKLIGLTLDFDFLRITSVESSEHYSSKINSIHSVIDENFNCNFWKCGIFKERYNTQISFKW